MHVEYDISSSLDLKLQANNKKTLLAARRSCWERVDTTIVDKNSSGRMLMEHVCI